MRTLLAGRTEFLTVSLTVLAVIVLFAAAMPVHLGSDMGARGTYAKAQINAYMAALRLFKSDTGAYPTTVQGLQALRAKPKGTINWHGPYVQKEIDPDPWQHPYAYKYPGDHGDIPEIISYGADGKVGGEGLNADIVSWKN